MPVSYPPITASHIAAGAHLYANRIDMVWELGRGHSYKSVAEIGVAFGDFSAIILDALHPAEFVAFDIFRLHELPMIWGKPTTETLGGKTHLEFYVERFRGCPVRAIVGDSSLMLREFPDGYFDMIYIDGDHSYKGVKADSLLAHKKISDRGILIFNDYIMYDHLTNSPYGVVPAVHELISEQGYEIVGYAFESNLFCDIALRRKQN